MGFKLQHRRFKPAITIDARAATISDWFVDDAGGLLILGGTFHLAPPRTNPKTGGPAWGAAIRFENASNVEISEAMFAGPGKADAKDSNLYGEGYGAVFHASSDVVLTRNQFSGFKVGLVLGLVDKFRITNSTFTAMRADGMDIAAAHDGLIEGNSCSGTIVRDGEHPDCVQLWSTPTAPPTSDIAIRHNKVTGNTQGISLFNHVRNGVDDGGFDRITIEDNDVNVAASQAIALSNGRDSVVRKNHVSTVVGNRYRASINATGDIRRCGNVVEPGAGKPGVTDPRC